MSIERRIHEYDKRSHPSFSITLACPGLRAFTTFPLTWSFTAYPLYGRSGGSRVHESCQNSIECWYLLTHTSGQSVPIPFRLFVNISAFRCSFCAVCSLGVLGAGGPRPKSNANEFSWRSYNRSWIVFIHKAITFISDPMHSRDSVELLIRANQRQFDGSFYW